MKATHTKTPLTFTPVTINITCETQEELDALNALFVSGLTAYAWKKQFGEIKRTHVQQALMDAGANQNIEVFHNELVRAAKTWPNC